MSLPSMLAQEPHMPIQRPTLAVAAGASMLNTIYFLTQSVDIQLQHMGSLQHPLVCLPGLPEGFVCVGSLSLGTGSMISFGSWAMEWLW